MEEGGVGRRRESLHLPVLGPPNKTRETIILPAPLPQSRWLITGSGNDRCGGEGGGGGGGRGRVLRNVTLLHPHDNNTMWSVWVLLNLMVFVHFDFCRAVPLSASWTTGADLGPLAATAEDVTAGGTSWTNQSDNRSKIINIQAGRDGPNTSLGPPPDQQTTEESVTQEDPSRYGNYYGKSHTPKVIQDLPSDPVKSEVVLGRAGGGGGGGGNGGHHLPFVQSRPPGVTADLQVIPEVAASSSSVISPQHVDGDPTTEASPIIVAGNNNNINSDNRSLVNHQNHSTQGVTTLPFHGSDDGLVPSGNVAVPSSSSGVEAGGDDDDDEDDEIVSDDDYDDTSLLGSTVILPLPQRDLTSPALAEDPARGTGDVTTSGNVVYDDDERAIGGFIIPVLKPSEEERDTPERPDNDLGRDENPSISPPDPQDIGAKEAPPGKPTEKFLLTTMIHVVGVSEGSTPKTAVNQLDGFDVGSLQFDLKDIILAVCGTVACMFTLCMLVTFTRCCCKKPKEDSDEEQQPPASQTKSLWKRSWKRPLDSAATTHTQESSTSENITQVTIERRESYTDHGDSGESSDDEEGGFTCGRTSRNTDTAKSRKSNYPESDDNKNALSVKDRIRAFEVPVPQDPGEVKVREGIKPRKNKPTSKAFEEFESKGILIGFGGGPRRRHGDDEDEHEDGDGICDSPIGILLPSPTSGLSQEDTPTSSRGLEDDEGVHTMESEEDEFAAIQRNTEILKSFRRAPPPKNRSKSRRSGRGRRPMRGQDVSSSEQIAEEPSSGSFGSRPTSGINSPATSATPEEEHDSFEASLHMTTTESLSAARSSSISQTPQSSMDSMDSPKRQPSLSSRDSPLRGSLTESPKRLLDSPKRQLRESPKRTPPVHRASDSDHSPGAYQPPGDRILHPKNGPSDFSLNIPMDFQQQRLGVRQVSPDSSSSKLFGKPHRPKSYHVDFAANSSSSSTEPGQRPSERVRPLRPMSQVHHQEMDMFLRDPPLGGVRGDHPLADLDGSYDQNHLHEPQQQQQQRDNISLSHGHLARNISSPVGRVLPQIRPPSSPGELRRWESEHSYLQEEGWKPSRLREGKTRPRMASPDQSTGSQDRELQTLRPTPEESQVREHPQSEKLERKVLPSETPESPHQAPDHMKDQGVTGVPTSEKTIFIPDHDVPPPRPPLPSWRQMSTPWKPESSDSKELPPRSPVKLSYVTNQESQHNSLTREQNLNREKNFESTSLTRHAQPTVVPPSRHFPSDPDIKSDLSRKPVTAPRRDFGRGHERAIEFTQSMDFERNWRDSTRRGRSLDRAQYTVPLDTRFVQSNPDVFHGHSLTKREIPYGDISHDQGMRESARRRIPPRKEFFEGQQHKGIVVPSSEKETTGVKPSTQLSRKSWHGNSQPPVNTNMVNGEQEIPWLRPSKEDAGENIKPSEVRKSMRRARAKSAEDGRSANLKLGRENYAPSYTGYTKVNDPVPAPLAHSQKDKLLPQYQSPSSSHRSRRDMYEIQPMSLDFKRNDRRSQSLRTPKSPETQRRPEPRRSMRDSRTRNTDPEINRRLYNSEFMRPAFRASKSWEERSATFPRQQQAPLVRHFENGTYRPPQGQKLLSSDPYLRAQGYDNKNEIKESSDNQLIRGNQIGPAAPMSGSKERIVYPTTNATKPVVRREMKPDSAWDLGTPLTAHVKSLESRYWRDTQPTNQGMAHVSSAPQMNISKLDFSPPYKIHSEHRYHQLAQHVNQHQWLNKTERKEVVMNASFEQTWNNAKASPWERPTKLYERNDNVNRPNTLGEDIRSITQEGVVQCKDNKLSTNEKDWPSTEPRHQNSDKVYPERVITPKTVNRGTDTNGFVDQNSNPREEKFDELWQDEFGCIKRNVTVQTEELVQPDWKEDVSTGTFYPKSLPLNGNMPPDISSSIDTNLNTWEAIDGPAGNLEPNGHRVLRFTQDPRWKESLVKPEVTSMYDRNILLERHLSQVNDGEVDRPSSQQSVDTSPQMRRTPDVVPLAERALRESKPQPLAESDYHFTFNFEIEATEI